MKVLAVILKIMMHVSVTGLLAVVMYFYVWKQKEDLSDEEIRDRMWTICLATVGIFIVLMVVISGVRSVG